MRFHGFRGFTLVEYTVWLGICAIALPIIAAVTINFIQARIKLAQKERALSSIIALNTLWSRDIEMASRDITQWHRSTHTELIWHTNNGDIGWQNNNQSLMRTEGIFSSKNNRWLKKSTITLLENCETISFTILRKKYIESVDISIKLADSYLDYSSSVRPLNTTIRYYNK